jgi:predicted nucleic acid-binding protein
MIHGVDTSFLVAVELVSHGRHGDCRSLRDRLVQVGDQFALVPQVLAEFIHIVTDPRRCAQPLSIDVAINRAESLWNAREAIQVLPDAGATAQFFVWMRQYQLGRKRLLDTLMAATFHAAGIHSVVTLNRSDFELFGCFTIHEP